MSFKVAIFTRGIKTHSYKYEQAFADGLRSHGHKILYCSWGREPDVDIDLAVIWSIKDIHTINYLKERNIDYVVLERGYIGDREKWTSCGFNGLNGHADFCNNNSDDKRLHHVQKYMKPIRKTTGGRIVIMGQVASDSSVKHIGFNKWLKDTYDYYKHHGVVYRPHPLEREPYIPEGLTVLEGTLEHAINNARMVITLNSNSSVDALLAGVITISCDLGSMIHNIGLFSRKQWLKDMSYTQWTIEEMESGETWNHLKKRYEDV